MVARRHSAHRAIGSSSGAYGAAAAAVRPSDNLLTQSLALFFPLAMCDWSYCVTIAAVHRVADGSVVGRVVRYSGGVAAA